MGIGPRGVHFIVPLIVPLGEGGGGEGGMRAWKPIIPLKVRRKVKQRIWSN